MTSLIGGVRVKKSSLRIDSYGTIDELNSYVGLVRDSVTEDHLKSVLYDVQFVLFNIGSVLAADPEKNKMALPEVYEQDIKTLEDEMDAMNEVLPPLTHFILPGGHPFVSYAHLARTVCRRAERIVVALADHDQVNPLIIQYLNRLSDYLFILARFIAHSLNVEENKWIPKTSKNQE
jgi:cob(I)alamin adenosyltransferase